MIIIIFLVKSMNWKKKERKGKDAVNKNRKPKSINDYSHQIEEQKLG